MILTVQSVPKGKCSTARDRTVRVALGWRGRGLRPATEAAPAPSSRCDSAGDHWSTPATGRLPGHDRGDIGTNLTALPRRLSLVWRYRSPRWPLT